MCESGVARCPEETAMASSKGIPQRAIFLTLKNLSIVLVEV